ncbi:DddA-like double-stranded DNA deaminase toxin [Saccharothrix sp. NPDC042600]|uniref:DddA-like double-stranded DNA deaminase toxin n=1 Tax=Saccharothrix TaxID=2071 RepID=UPI003400C5FD|nr:SCP1.201-like deaminase [Saccharothrix mutabilis subsp. capreolus]
MSSIGEVAQSVSQACDKASQCRDALGQAQDLAEEAHDLLAAHLRGAIELESDTEQMLANFHEVINGVKDLWKVLGAGMDRAQAALTALTGQTAPAPDPIAQRPAQPLQQPSPVRQAPAGQPPVVPPDRVEGLRHELPPPITPGERGRKTHGRWITPDGDAEPIVSGKDDDSDAADAMLRNMGMRAASAKTADVEIKLAARMVREGVQHATVVINNTPCVGRFGCDTLVPILLPPGSTLTVHGVNAQGERFRKRYTGGARPWWR